MSRAHYGMFFLVLLLGMASGCSNSPSQPHAATDPIVWPDPPEQARIAFVGEFSRSSDLGIKEGIWSRFLSIAAGSRYDDMVRPMAVATTADQQVIFVADPDAFCVHRYDLRRSQYTCLTAGRNESPVSPIGLAITADGWLFVSDSQLGRLFQAAPNAKELEGFEVSSELDQPTGLAWDEARNRLVVTDTGKQSVLVFDRQGELVDELGRRGSAPAQFNFPTYLWMDVGGELLVTDSLNFRVQRFDRDQNFVEMFGENGDQQGDFARPKGVATDSHGHVYVVDALLQALQIFDRQGRLLMSIGGRGRAAGQFWLPNGVFVAPDNTIFVADSHNKRIQVFRYVGPEP